MEWLVPEQLAQLALGTPERPLPGIAQSPAGTLDVEVEHGHRGLIPGDFRRALRRAERLREAVTAVGLPSAKTLASRSSALLVHVTCCDHFNPGAAKGRPAGSLPRRWAAATPTLNCCHVHIVLPWSSPLVTAFSRLRAITPDAHTTPPRAPSTPRPRIITRTSVPPPRRVALTARSIWCQTDTVS
jgi:hypothetical protein